MVLATSQLCNLRRDLTKRLITDHTSKHWSMGGDSSHMIFSVSEILTLGTITISSSCWHWEEFCAFRRELHHFYAFGTIAQWQTQESYAPVDPRLWVFVSSDGLPWCCSIVWMEWLKIRDRRRSVASWKASKQWTGNDYSLFCTIWALETADLKQQKGELLDNTQNRWTSAPYCCWDQKHQWALERTRQVCWRIRNMMSQVQTPAE